MVDEGVGEGTAGGILKCIDSWLSLPVDKSLSISGKIWSGVPLSTFLLSIYPVLLCVFFPLNFDLIVKICFCRGDFGSMLRQQHENSCYYVFFAFPPYITSTVTSSCTDIV